MIINFLKYFYRIFGIRIIFNKYILYNKIILKILTKLNSLRWPQIELYLIVWPPAMFYFNEIKKDLVQHCRVKKSKKFIVKKENFKDFTKHLYSLDNASQRKINIKLNRLNKDSDTMALIVIEISNPKMLAQDFFNYVKCDQVSQIKSEIRSKYKSKIKDYIYDIIIHSTEADYQNKNVCKLIERYSS